MGASSANENILFSFSSETRFCEMEIEDLSELGLQFGGVEVKINNNCGFLHFK